MKLKFILSMLAMTVALGSTAQNRERAQREYPSKEMIETVKLTAEQVSALKENEKIYTETMSQLRSKRDDRDKMAENLKAARALRLYGIKKILPTEQYVNYLEYEIINPAMPSMMPGNRPRTSQRSSNNFGGNGGNNDFNENFNDSF